MANVVESPAEWSMAALEDYWRSVDGEGRTGKITEQSKKKTTVRRRRSAELRDSIATSVLVEATEV